MLYSQHRCLPVVAYHTFSPKGHQFATCKEVSSYLMSLLGYSEAKPTATQTNSAGVHGLHVNVSFLTMNLIFACLNVPVLAKTIF